jgi:hypothetical protein
MAAQNQLEFWSRTREQASPLVFIALSSLIINSYRQMGQSTKIHSSYFGLLFYHSAAMHVDDTNLLHLPESSVTDPKELIKRVQQATINYGHLAQATGSILKGKKCSVYFWTTSLSMAMQK